MHIPDGYLSPATCGVMYAASFPFIFKAFVKTKGEIENEKLPVVAVLAAFDFVIMMFNVPVPGGTTAHAVGSVLMAILVGPWTAILLTGLVLAIQALLFGDGGILTLGANIFNMAIVMPFAGHFVFKLLKSHFKKIWIPAAIAGYTGINLAALFAALELGLQPLLFHAPDGTPLYCPYGLDKTVPAMLLSHLTMGGIAEAVITAGVIWFLKKTEPELLE